MPTTTDTCKACGQVIRGRHARGHCRRCYRRIRILEIRRQGLSGFSDDEIRIYGPQVHLTCQLWAHYGELYGTEGFRSVYKR